MSDVFARAAEKIALWRRDPVRMVVDEFKVQHLDQFQIDTLRAFADPNKQRIALKASKGPGKTAVLAWCGWNFLACYADAGNHPNGAATSITADNLRDNLWKEFAKWQQRSEFFREAFTWTKTRIFANDFPATWWISARTWSKSADAQSQSDTLAGLHSDFIGFFLDETGAYPSSIVATAEAGLSGPRFGKILQAGNPTHTEGPLYDACEKHSDLWTVITINGDPDNPNRASRVDKAWARQQIEMYGRDNPWVKVNVFGEFPPSSLNTLLGPDEVRAAMNRHSTLRQDQFQWAQKRLGVDVARFGDDRTVLFPRQGLAAWRPVTMRGARTNVIAARIMLAKSRWGHEITLIDDTGHWGHGVVDNLLTVDEAVIPVQFHAPALDPRYKNRRAEMWLNMADWVKRGGALPNIPELTAELTIPTYTFSQGKFLLEDKDIIKERLGRSPDLADALALTFAIPDQPSESTNFVTSKGTRAQPGKLVSEWDPFEGEL